MMALRCPFLVSLNYGFSKGQHVVIMDGLDAVLQSCKEVHTVNLTSPFGFTNAHVTCVTQRCGKLQSLRLVLSDSGTNEECIAILRPRLSELVNLSLLNLQCTSDTPLRLLAEHCSQLVDLRLRNLSGCTDGAIAALLSALPALQSLCLSYYHSLSDATLMFIGARCKSLRALHIFGAWGFSEKGVAAIAAGCPNLRVLTVSPENPHFNPTVLSVWRALRPQLTILTEDLDDGPFARPCNRSGYW
jgi:hypothetical protein